MKNKSVRTSAIRPLILLLGASGAGKTTVATELSKQYGWSQVSSYTTRNPRYEGEGGHVFIPRDVFSQLENLVAWTVIDKEFYGATSEQVDHADIYVIDARGAVELKKSYKSNRPVAFVFLEVSEKDRAVRMGQRGSNPSERIRRQSFDSACYAASVEAASQYDNTLFIENKNLSTTVETIAKFAAGIPAVGGDAT